jgi:hypothetical protein
MTVIAPEIATLAGSLGAAPTWSRTADGKYEWVASFTLERGGRTFTGTRVGSKATTGVMLHQDQALAWLEDVIELRRETWFERLGKRLRVNRELQLGDAEFDRDVYVYSDASDDSIRRSLDAPARMVVREIVLHGGTAYVEPKRVALLVPVGLFGARTDVEAMLTATAMLCDAVAASAQDAHGPYGRGGAPAVPRKKAPRVARGVACAAFFALIVFGLFVLSGLPPTYGAIAWVGAACGAAAWALTTVALGALFRGRSSSLGTVLLASFPFVVWLPFGVQTLRFYNAAADHAEARTYPGVARHVTHQKGPPTVGVTVLSPSGKWPEMDVPYERVEIPSSESWIKDGGQVTVSVHGGALGYPWIDQVVQTER